MNSRVRPGVLAFCVVALLIACHGSTEPTGSLSSNGPIVYMHRNLANGSVDVWRIAPDGSQAQQLTTSDGADHTWPALTADGSRIAYISLSPPAGLWTMRVDGSGQRFLTSRVGTESRLSWSPDASQIALAGYLAQGNGVSIVNADGTGYSAIGGDSLGATSLSWAPNGQVIAFSSDLGVPTNSQASIYRMRTDGSSIAPIYIPQGDSGALYPAWSPDGSHIAFAIGSLGDNMRIVVANADGSDLHIVSSTPMCGDSATYANDQNPSWSRDGHYIVFQRTYSVCPPSTTSTPTDLFIVHTSGFGLTQLTHDGSSFGPTW